MSIGIVKHFGRIIRKRRMAAALSQEELAEKAGLHPTYISIIERGIKSPTLDSAGRIADALGAHLSQLIEEAEKHRSLPEAGEER